MTGSSVQLAGGETASQGIVGHLKSPYLFFSPLLPDHQYGHDLSFSFLIMMLHRPNSPLVRYGPRSDPHPVRPQQLRRLSEANENMPVRPPRNPARPVTFGGEQPVLPSPVTLRPTTAPGDVDGRRKRIDDGDGRPANAVSTRLPYDDRVQIIIQ